MIRVHHFHQMSVQTELQPNGEYCAVPCDLDGPQGWGKTRMEAIVDLREQMQIFVDIRHSTLYVDCINTTEHGNA